MSLWIINEFNKNDLFELKFGMGDKFDMWNTISTGLTSVQLQIGWWGSEVKKRCQAYMKVLIGTNQMLFTESKKLYSLLRYSIFKLRKYKGLYGSRPEVLGDSEKSTFFK